MSPCFIKQRNYAIERHWALMLLPGLLLVLLLGELVMPTMLVLGDLTVLETNKTYASRIAAFGPRIKEVANKSGSPLEELGVVGNLIPVEYLVPYNRRGCEPIPPIQTRNLTNWIALVERGDCTFLKKVHMMQLSGAKAVIVGDNRLNRLVIMSASGNTSDVRIPSIFLLQSDYHEIRYLASTSSKPFSVKLVRDGLVELPMIDMLYIIILAPSLITLIIYAIWLFHERSERLSWLAPRQLVASLPTKYFRLAKRLDSDPSRCTICLEDFINDDLLRVLPCSHEFHIACIDPWLTMRRKLCPVCKQDVCPVTDRTPLLSFPNEGNYV